MSDSEKLLVLVSEDSNFRTEFTMSLSLPKVDTTLIDGVAQFRSTGCFTLRSNDLSDASILEAIKPP